MNINLEMPFPHDALFQGALAYRAVSEEILTTCLPKYVLNKINLTTIKYKNKSYIDQNLRKQESDVLLSVKDKFNKENFIYILIEHQRKPQKFLSVRVLNYKIKIIADYIKQNKNIKHLPPVWSIVYYNGERPYSYNLDFFELFSDPQLMKNSIIEPLSIYDLNTVPDHIISQRKFMGLLDYCLKHASRGTFVDKSKDFCEIFNKIQELNQQLNTNPNINQNTESELLDLISILFKYIINVVPENQLHEVRTVLQNNLPEGEAKNKFVSMGRGIWNEGWNDGEQVGKQIGKQIGEKKGIDKNKKEVAFRAYKQGLSLEIIKNLTDYSIQELNKILPEPEKELL